MTSRECPALVRMSTRPIARFLLLKNLVMDWLGLHHSKSCLQYNADMLQVLWPVASRQEQASGYRLSASSQSGW